MASCNLQFIFSCRGGATTPGQFKRALSAPRREILCQGRAQRSWKTTSRSENPALYSRRWLLSVAPPLLFLPWKGCSEGGFYDTGKLLSLMVDMLLHLYCGFLYDTGVLDFVFLFEGVHENCQKIYQPAAAAEERWVLEIYPQISH